MCKVRPSKDDPNRTRITVNGGDIYYAGDVATPTGSLELVKLIINSVLSRPGAKFACFYVKNVYLDTPLEEPEYVRIKLTEIPKELLGEYTILKFQRNGWIYFEIIRGCYGIKHSGKLSNDLLHTRLERQTTTNQPLLRDFGSTNGDKLCHGFLLHNFIASQYLQIF